MITIPETKDDGAIVVGPNGSLGDEYASSELQLYHKTSPNDTELFQ